MGQESREGCGTESGDGVSVVPRGRPGQLLAARKLLAASHNFTRRTLALSCKPELL
jgi:hypothetical protein